jgi:uncharacterized iron-regulated membrane protein
MDPRRARCRHITAHELGHTVYWADGAPGRRTTRPEDLRRGLHVHSRLQAAHMGRPVTAESSSLWGWVALGTFLLLVLGVALWIR